MKKNTKKMYKIIPMILVGFIIIGNVFGVGWDVGTLPIGNVGDQGGTIGKVAGNVWDIIVIVVRVLAVAAIVIAGVRYMLASANEKADIKKQLGILVLGAVLVFGATFVLQIIGKITSEVVGVS